MAVRATFAQSFPDSYTASDVEPVAQLGGGVGTGLHVDGDRAWYLFGWTLICLDIADPSRPVPLGRYDLLEGRDVFIAGGRAHVATAFGLQIVDVSDPSQPRFLGGYPLRDPISFPHATWLVNPEVFSSGNFVYMKADGTLYTFDSADPSSPTLAGHVSAPESFVGISGGRPVFAMGKETNGRVDVIEIGNPGSPVPVGQYVFGGIINRIDIDGDRAYIAGSGGLRVLDLSDPTSPTSLAVWPGGNETHRLVRVDGDRIYLTDNSATLRIVDVADPTSPLVLGSLEDVLATDLRIGDGVLLLPWFDRLQIVDVTDPTTLREIGTYCEPASGQDVIVSGNRASIIRSDSGFQFSVHLMDVGNPYLPRPIGLASVMHDAFYEHAVNGDHLYAASYWLEVVDISDPTSPTCLGTYRNIVPDPRKLRVAGDTLYIGGMEKGLSIVDISDPSSLTLRSALPDFVVGSGFRVVGKTAYFARPTELAIYDLSDPTSPVSSGRYPLPPPPDGQPVNYRDVEVVADRAYVTSGGVVILDVSDPVSPTFLGAYAAADPRYLPNRIAVSEGLAVLYKPWGGLFGRDTIEFLDVQNPREPTRIGRFSMVPGIAGSRYQFLRVAIKNGFVYAAADGYGLWILRPTSFRRASVQPIWRHLP